MPNPEAYANRIVIDFDTLPKEMADQIARFVEAALHQYNHPHLNLHGAMTEYAEPDEQIGR